MGTNSRHHRADRYPAPLPIAVGHQPTSDARHGHRCNKERKGKGYTPGERKTEGWRPWLPRQRAYATAEPKDDGDSC